MTPTPLAEHYLPIAQFRERHHCFIAAPPARTIAAAAAYDPADDPLIRSAIALREVPVRLMDSLPGRERKPRAAFGLKNFTLLEQREDQLAYGLIGQFWRLNYGLRAFADGDAFNAFDSTDAAKLVLSFSAVRTGDGRTRLETETRVFCPTVATRLQFLPYWLVIRPVSGLIRRRMLALIRQRSEPEN